MDKNAPTKVPLFFAHFPDQCFAFASTSASQIHSLFLPATDLQPPLPDGQSANLPNYAQPNGLLGCLNSSRKMANKDKEAKWTARVAVGELGAGNCANKKCVGWLWAAVEKSSRIWRPAAGRAEKSKKSVFR